MAYKKVEQYDEQITSELTENYKDALGLLGEDPQQGRLVKNSGKSGEGDAVPYAGVYDGCKSHPEFCQIP